MLSLEMLVKVFVIILFISHTDARQVKNPFQKPSKLKVQSISECIHVTSEEGLYSYRKTASTQSYSHNDEIRTPTVCGLYVVADPDQVIEMTVNYLNVDCDDGGMMSFVDGWELNGAFFPGILDHELPIEKRFTEFCTNSARWSTKDTQLLGKTFRSSQNAALMQYRIPNHGAFVVSVRFLVNKHPCHIMVEGVAPSYTLKNFGSRSSNCTLTALFPAVVAIHELSVGPPLHELSFNCLAPYNMDYLDIGGSTGIDSANMQVASTACGTRSENAVTSIMEQAIFCGVTTIRLRSSGLFPNSATISIRHANEEDLSLVTAVCDA